VTGPGRSSGYHSGRTGREETALKKAVHRAVEVWVLYNDEWKQMKKSTIAWKFPVEFTYVNQY
jgi:hypothetical protein